jgi:DNA-binding response OmpR family regulator
MAKKIMIVDDELHVVKYLESIFQDNGYDHLRGQRRQGRHGGAGSRKSPI